MNFLRGIGGNIMAKFKVEWKELMSDTRVAIVEAENKQEAIRMVKNLQIDNDYQKPDSCIEFVKILNSSINAQHDK